MYATELLHAAMPAQLPVGVWVGGGAVLEGVEWEEDDVGPEDEVEEWELLTLVGLDVEPPEHALTV